MVFVCRNLTPDSRALLSTSLNSRDPIPLRRCCGVTPITLSSIGMRAEEFQPDEPDDRSALQCNEAVTGLEILSVILNCLLDSEPRGSWCITATHDATCSPRKGSIVATAVIYRETSFVEPSFNFGATMAGGLNPSMGDKMSTDSRSLFTVSTTNVSVWPKYAAVTSQQPAPRKSTPVSIRHLSGDRCISLSIACDSASVRDRPGCAAGMYAFVAREIVPVTGAPLRLRMLIFSSDSLPT